MLPALSAEAAELVKYCRINAAGRPAYAIVEKDRVRLITAAPYEAYEKTEQTFALSEVKFLPPTVPTQVLALAWNYKSHFVVGNVAGQDDEIPPKFRIPQPFFKSPSCLVGHGDKIVLPEDAGPTHAEGEMVIVIGKRAKSVPRDKALDYVLGVTCGNDVSERYWQYDEQNKDIQWWRAKGADTFGPCGPLVVTGLDFDNLQLRLRLNGAVKQDVNTSFMMHDVAGIVSFISRYVTLLPGDLIFTGTPGNTEEIRPGDFVEVELEGVGVLRNEVTREQGLPNLNEKDP